MSENPSLVEMIPFFIESGIDMLQVFCFSEAEDGMIPMKIGAVGMDPDEYLDAGKIPISTLANIETLVDDPEAQAVLGLDQITEPEEPDNLVNFNDYRED